MLERSISKFGQVDILVNNAAGNFISPTERLSANAFSTVIDIVLKGTANCTLTFGKYWIAQKIPASVLNIVTTYAFTGSGYVVPSAVAKGGGLTMTRSLAAEWGKYNIRHNAIAPGPFPTKGAWDRLLPGELAEKFDFKNRVPLKRVGDHQELANLAAFLVSDFAGYINGEVITIDGGEWLQGAGQMNGMEAVPDEMWDMIDRNVVVAAGGFDSASHAEDMDMTVRMVAYMRENKKAYRIVQCPYSLCWTEGPPNIKVLNRQRTRWGRGMLQFIIDRSSD